MAQTDGPPHPPPRTLPADAKAYHQSKPFSATTVPQGLLSKHSTKAGTWGLVRVAAGQVEYVLDGEETPLAMLGAGETWVVLPEELHFVRLSEDAEFSVEFYKRAGTAVPSDPHG